MSNGRLPELENNTRKFKNFQPKKWSRSLTGVVVYEKFQYKSLTENIFGVLGRWSLMADGHTWRIDCTFKRDRRV